MSALLAPALAVALLWQQVPAPAAIEPPASAPLVAEAPVPTAFAAPLPRTGLFSIGLGLAPLELGPLQVISAGGTSLGVAGAIGVEVDLGPHLALRVPLEIAYAGSSQDDATGVEQSTVFLYAGFSPGLTYRFRSERDQRWTAFVGGSLKLGGFMFGRQLLGVAPNPPPATMQEFSRLGAAPTLTSGVLFTPVRWFSLRIAVDYTYIYVAHTSVHALAETIAPQLSF